MNIANSYAKALKAIENKCGLEIYNPETGIGYSVIDVVNAFEHITMVKTPYYIKPSRNVTVVVYYSNPTKVLCKLD